MKCHILWLYLLVEKRKKLLPYGDILLRFSVSKYNLWLIGHFNWNFTQWYPLHLDLYCYLDATTTRKRSLGEAYVFTPVCQSFCSQGGCYDVTSFYRQHHPPPGQHHPHLGQYHPPLDSTIPPWTVPPDSTTTTPNSTNPYRQHRLRSTSGRYTTYWDVFLFVRNVLGVSMDTHNKTLKGQQRLC